MSAEKHQFQAEIQQLLNIVIHSLYTDKAIFIRELISNAADALEKLRFLQSSGQTVYQPDQPLKISMQADEKENTITLTCSQSGNTFQFETINTINPGYQKSENGIGLENIRKRLQSLYAGRHELNVCQAEDSFTVNLKIDNRVTEKA